MVWIYGINVVAKVGSFFYTLYGIIILLLLFIPTTLICFILNPFFGRRIWHFSLKIMSKLLLLLLFIPVEVKSKEHIPVGTCIFTSNQLSHIDGFIIRSITSQPFFAITEPLNKFHPFFRFWMRRLDFVDLRRTHKEDQNYPESHSRKQGVVLAAKQLKSGISMLIFPEGHFERQRKLLTFYSGAVKLALQTGVPIVPISLQNTHLIWPPDYLLRKPAKIRIQIGKPLQLQKTGNPSKRLISSKTILLKKEIAKMLPQSFKPPGWKKNV